MLQRSMLLTVLNLLLIATSIVPLSAAVVAQDAPHPSIERDQMSPSLTSTVFLPIVTSEPDQSPPQEFGANVTRKYRGDDGSLLYLRAVGNVVYGYGEHPSATYAFVLRGVLDENGIDATYWDIPKGTRMGHGGVELRIIRAGARLERISPDPAIGTGAWEALAPDPIPWLVQPPAGFQATTQNNLTGAFKGRDGSHHYVRELEDMVVWVAESANAPDWVSVFVGARDPQLMPVAGGPPVPVAIFGSYADVTKGLGEAAGSFGLQIEENRNLKLYQIGVTRTRDLEPDYALDWTRFENSIRDAFDNKTVGYAYAIGQGRYVLRAGAGGFRRLAVDGGAQQFTVNTQSQALSTSKTVTAIALVKALHDRGLSVNTAIAPFLPTCWSQGPGVDALTFRELLDHTSGMPASVGINDPYLALQQFIAGGRTGAPGSYNYNNVAYSLMRYLTPLVANEAAAKQVFVQFNCQSEGAMINLQLSTMFVQYLFTQILAPAQVQASFDPTDNFALLYNYLNHNIPGIGPNPEGWLRSGPGYLAISVLNYVKLLSALDGGEILPNPVVQSMYSSNLGFDPPAAGQAGLYYTKAGGVTAGCGIKGGAQLMVYPGGVYAYVMVNSGIAGSSTLWYFDHDHDGTTDGPPLDWGLADDRALVGDFDSDGQVDDSAVFRPSTLEWYFDYDHDGDTDAQIANWGQCEDIPLAGDFDSDGRVDDIAVFRAANETWYFDYNRNGSTDDQLANWGIAGDSPLAGDFDSDGQVDDIAVFRAANQTWYFDYSRNGSTDDQLANWGAAGDAPLTGDFDSDGRLDDIAVFRPATQAWYFNFDHNGDTDAQLANWGLAGDSPLAGDFDGDGWVDDTGLARPSMTSLRTVLRSAFDDALE